MQTVALAVALGYGGERRPFPAHQRRGVAAVLRQAAPLELAVRAAKTGRAAGDAGRRQPTGPGVLPAGPRADVAGHRGAALAVPDVVVAEDLPGRAEVLGGRITAAIRALRHPLVVGVRGVGRLLGIALCQDAAAALEGHLREAGYLTNAAQPGVLRLAPPLVLTDALADGFLAALPAALDLAAASPAARSGADPLAAGPATRSPATAEAGAP